MKCLYAVIRTSKHQNTPSEKPPTKTESPQKTFLLNTKSPFNMPHLIPLLISSLTLSQSTTIAGVFSLSLPNDSGTSISLSGDLAQGYGVAGYMNEVEGNANSGHLLENVVLNAPVIPDGPGSRNLTAHYYVSGREAGPFANGATDTAFASGLNGMNSTGNYVNNQALNLNLLTFRFGPNNGQPNTSTWNLGGDQLNVDWSGNLASSVEERIYKANPADVSSGLYFDGTKILDFGYSDIYEILDYGGTQLGNDDTISAYSNPVSASKEAGLNPVNDGLADAILADIVVAGGKIQLRFDTFQPISSFGDENGAGDGLWVNNLGFSGSLQVVPEPSEYAFAMAVFLGLFITVRNRSKRSLTETPI